MGIEVEGGVTDCTGRSSCECALQFRVTFGAGIAASLATILADVKVDLVVAGMAAF